MRVERQGNGLACRYCPSGYVPRGNQCVSQVAVTEAQCRRQHGSQFLRVERQGNRLVCRFCYQGFVPLGSQCVSQVAVTEAQCRRQHGSQFLRIERQGNRLVCRFCYPGSVPRGGQCVRVTAGPRTVPGQPRTFACNSRVKQGGDRPETVFVNLGNFSGRARFSYNMITIKDRMLVYLGNTLVIDTGCVSGRGSKYLSILVAPAS